ncbi:hypothetical protein I314_06509 [Cryptococcus bacillisporus CA1873]|uniref:Uncharacterized protein n=1 Tax=Cryptococcus bacillisporus CA1873 TaxID=1296111 RepID=A0ABR5B201_CRYGA|nr:hypothetical protein I314_06509 [Cryptococcus bacillisporus CA1873]|eukprot:KIR57617.1 hypothetical protein I314_06509 [Cryptococcus gattii CA1873]
MSLVTVTPKTLSRLVNSPPREACLSRSRTVGRVDQDCKGDEPFLYGPSNYLPSLWSGHQFEVVGGVEWALSGNVDVRFG